VGTLFLVLENKLLAMLRGVYRIRKRDLFWLNTREVLLAEMLEEHRRPTDALTPVIGRGIKQKLGDQFAEITRRGLKHLLCDCVSDF